MHGRANVRVKRSFSISLTNHNHHNHQRHFHKSLLLLVDLAMAIPASLVVVPFGILFIFSGIIVNLIQAIFFILARPVSKGLYRKINKVVAELLWLELIWLIDWWAAVKVKVYTDAETFQLLGKEHALLICNHRSDVDWLVGWVLAQRSGCLGSALAIMKKEAKFLPIIGWSMWFSDYVFLERSWSKDENTLKSGFKWLEDYPMPFWLALFVEGTRFTQAKLLAAQEFSASRGLPVPRNVLLPRTKGFVSAVSHMRSFVPAIYDFTVAVPQNQPSPTMLRILRGKPSVVNVQIKRHSMQELPETADGISQWCKDVFVTKDALLEKYITKDKFSDQEFQDIGRPKKSLFVVIFWSCLIGYGLFKLFQWLSFLASWEVIAFSATFLVLVTIVMQIVIQSSESERSTPPKVPLEDSVKERLLQR
ncbi:Acyltransferase domain-containing protein [Cephalotus follicularis]|uniref:1-acylglycerol-3-phosphate O-acyltransferase n=1 Tax=Cephalotus follicularis TaxID=3775 RepID=A0A1Q3ATF5_CEPFO|nr:Acyltransferase domain-containing protein [Cephalotus follicularis]